MNKLEFLREIKRLSEELQRATTAPRGPWSLWTVGSWTVEYGWIYLHDYVSATEADVGEKVMAAARREGFAGTLTERLADLEWKIVQMAAVETIPHTNPGEPQPLKQPFGHTLRDRWNFAASQLFQYGGIEGEHHRVWLIDQIVRSMEGPNYDNWVREFNEYKDEGGETYSAWQTGIAP